MKASYPELFDSISLWAKANSIKPSEARVRFAQGAILSAIANSRSLKSILVFKGGNALDFVWQPNRSTEDNGCAFFKSEAEFGRHALHLQVFSKSILLLSSTSNR
ncbi:MAG: hypothetical protein EOO38_20535 [Cytophagaceae bacterium]|nr:MAG: hypothetical protein EOO38_20535 [Cytophagaceae bacterium]